MKIKYLALGALALVGISALGAKKAIDVSSIASQLQTTLRAIRKLDFTANGINLEVDIAIKNPTKQELSIATAGAVTLKRLLIYDKKQKLVATAEPNISALTIVPGGTIVLDRVPIVATYSSVLDTIFGGFSTNPDDYTVKAEITALGTTMTV